LPADFGLMDSLSRDARMPVRRADNQGEVQTDGYSSPHAGKHLAETTQFNDAMIAGDQAEQVGFAQLDAATVALSEAYYSASQNSDGADA
jgi:hypothetical protein